MIGHDRLSRLLAFDRDERVAIEWRGHRLTYSELAEAVEGLARTLGERGAARTNVLVLGPLCPAYVVALLAALRSGAVPMPVDTGMSAERYAWAEHVAQPSTVLTSDASSAAQYQGASSADELLLEAATGRVVLDIAARPRHRLRSAPRYPGRDAGYLIPTSGSTGTPKAVVGSRSGLYGFLSWFASEFALGRQDVCAAATRVNFDPSLRELLSVLIAGGRLSLPEIDSELDFRARADHLVASGATVAFLVPSLARRVADVLAAESARLDDLRLGFFAGEVLSPRVADQWTGLAPRAEFVNLYGMTEGTLAQLFLRGIRGTDGSRSTVIPVGRPRPGVSVAIDQPDPDGRGEVLVTSAASALGVLTDRSDTDPGAFPLDPMGTVIRTGDIGFFTEHGELVVAGRTGNDLKVSGTRVSFHRFADEVEELPGVRQCVVVDQQGPHAFLSVAKATVGEEAALRAAVRETARRLRLPQPAIHLREELPLLRSGKIDRVALAASVGAPRVAAGPVAAPDTSVVETLRGLLGPGAASSDSFVDAGITSLDMMAFVLEVNRRFGVSLSVQECFGHRDVASLARVVERASERTAPTPAPARREDHRGTSPGASTFPLSTRQQAYMAICMADGNADWCNISREIRIGRAVTVAETEAAVATIIARHDVLRLSLTADWTRQVHTEAADLSCPVFSHGETGTIAPTEASHRVQVQEARVHAVSRLLDPASAPPLRVVVVPGEGVTSLLVVAHHLFVDGLSLDLITGELRSVLLGTPIGEAPPPRGYRDYCLATQRVPGVRPPDAEYWHGLLKHAGQVALPEATGEDARLGELLSRPCGVTGTRTAQRLAAANGVSVFSVMLAAFEQAVSRTFGLGPLTIVVPVQVRQGAPPSTAGMFTSQLVVRGRAAASLPASAREFAHQLETGTAKSSWEFDQRTAELGAADTDHFPLSTVLFNQHPRQRGLRVHDLGQWRPRALGRTLRYQLQGELQMSASDMVVTYYYRRGIAMGGTDVIDRLHANVLTALGEGEGISRAG